MRKFGIDTSQNLKDFSKNAKRSFIGLGPGVYLVNFFGGVNFLTLFYKIGQHEDIFPLL
jgi:hypothetical protein